MVSETRDGGVYYESGKKRLRLQILRNLGGTVVGNVSIVLLSALQVLFPFLGINRKTAFLLSIVKSLHRQWIP